MFSTLIQQFKEVWERLAIGQRLLLSTSAIACVLVVGGTIYWATQPDYVVLASNLSPQSAAAMVGQLESRSIEYELSFSGSVVSVPRSNLGRARLALKDVLEPEMAEASSGFGGAFPGSPMEEGDQRTRSQEQRISRSIEKIRGVKTATVHISKAPDTPFVSEQKPTTASVILELNSSVTWSGTTAQSVLILVARAVEGLAPEDITLMDSAGRVFAASTGMNGDMSSQFEHRQMIEHSLAAKAETMLAELLGPGKAVVRVTADIDFKETTRTEMSFDPDGKVKTTETVETVSQTGGVRPGDEVGVAPNLVPDLGSSDSLGDYKKEINSTDYENATINQTVRDSPGSILRLSIAAIVDLSPDAVDTGEEGAPAAPASEIAKEDIEGIIQQAVGFDEERNDALQVLFAPMKAVPAEVEIPSLVSTVGQYENIIDSAILGIGVLLAAVLGFLALRKMKPVVVTGEQSSGLTPEQMTSILELSERVKGSPDAAAQILSVWMGEQTLDDAKSGSQSRKAA